MELNRIYTHMIFVLLFFVFLIYVRIKQKTYFEFPRNLFQTHKSIEYVQSNELLNHAMNSWKQHETFRHSFYNDAQMDAFMKRHYHGTLWYDAYTRLHKPVMKSDFWRYCVLYQHGGIYADIDTVCLKPPEVVFGYPHKDTELVVVREPHGPMYCQWVFAAQRNSTPLRAVIDHMTEHILKADAHKLEFPTEQEVFDLTGPVVFTEGIQKHGKANVHVIENPADFHAHQVRHMYMGASADGWKKQL